MHTLSHSRLTFQNTPEQKLKICWTQRKEEDQIHIYGLDMSSVDYPAGI